MSDFSTDEALGLDKVSIMVVFPTGAAAKTAVDTYGAARLNDGDMIRSAIEMGSEVLVSGPIGALAALGDIIEDHRVP